MQNMNTSRVKRLSDRHRQQLLEIARNSIVQGLTDHTPLAVVADEYPPELQAKRASFVTLMKHGALRGCIGHLEAIQTLVSDVAENAFSAAFRDPRFPPVTEAESKRLDIHLSVLTPSTAMIFESELDLVKKIRPGIDGVILIEGSRRGTFLPSVWESLPDPHDFIRQLKLKAGLPPDYWSDTLEVRRYETESFADHKS